jgi:PKD repeat protein
MSLKSLSIFLALAFAMSCSKEGNPVALPTTPGGQSSPVSLAVKADQSQLIAGTSKPATLTVTATHADGTPAADGTVVSLNTSLGGFSFDTAGKPVQLTTVTLVAGHASVQFFPGKAAGTANIMASLGTTVASLNLPIALAPVPPVANFTFSPNGLTVLFTDTSTGSPVTYTWDFGDAQTSNEHNPSHTYRNAATYPVMLVVSNDGGQSSKSQFVTASLGTPPVASFDATVTGLQVNFVDSSVGATSWQWNFGDGNTATVRNPIHSYIAPGAYTVTLAAANAAGSSTSNKVVTIAPGTPPKAAFSFTVTAQQVNFVDSSTGSPSAWQWSFGDSGTSTARNPIHTYSSAGAFTATLTVSNNFGSDASSQVVTIAPGQPPKSAFTFKTSGLQATFADASTGSPSSWSWTFGDGGQSTQQNPVHTYGAFGNYTVSLLASNSAGSNSSNQIVTLAPPPAPVASFTATVNASNGQVNFVDTSTGTPTSWTWNFGDGSALSTQQNPIHIYPVPNSYTVTLTAANASGSSKASQVVVVPPPPAP